MGAQKGVSFKEHAINEATRLKQVQEKNASRKCHEIKYYEHKIK